MSDLLLELLKMRNDIEHDGWLVIPPSERKHELNVRVEWFIDGKKYGFEQRYCEIQLSKLKISITAEFVCMANDAINRLLSEAG